MIPIPGQTIINGRKILTALEILVPTQLTIIPLMRAQSPLYVERSLEHNFLKFVGQALRGDLITIKLLDSGIIESTGRRYMAVDLRQENKNAIVDGKEGVDMLINSRVIGIEGELNDHMLFLNYPTVSGDSGLEDNLQTLIKLVKSFRPLKIVTAEKRRREIAESANKKFTAFMAKRGNQLFLTEFKFLLLRLQSSNLDDPETRIHVMKLLKPFEFFARELNLQNKELDAFWKALHQAEVGDASDFKTNLTQMIDDLKNEREPDSLPNQAEPS